MYVCISVLECMINVCVFLMLFPCYFFLIFKVFACLLFYCFCLFVFEKKERRLLELDVWGVGEDKAQTGEHSDSPKKMEYGRNRESLGIL